MNGTLELTPTLVGFARTLRAAGVPATTDRLQHFVEALDHVDASSRETVYWAGRLTLCSCRDDLERYDRVFAAYFGGDRPTARTQSPPRMVVLSTSGNGQRGSDEADDQEDASALAVGATDAEALRHRDFAAMSDDEREQLNRLLAAFRLPGEARRSRRWQPSPRGAVDPARTIRELLRAGGEPALLEHRRHRLRPRSVVVLADVSGSMSPYADALLRFAHAAARRRGSQRTEVFTIGTRLTRVTRELAHRDPDTAMAAVAAAVPDWSGGTRLGELFKEFCDRWGQRGMARGAVVVVLSDGWEQGDPGLLAEQTARIGRLARRVVWANPRKGRSGYEPLVAGMAAALPHVDDFVAGHSLAALEHLARTVAGAGRAARLGRRA